MLPVVLIRWVELMLLLTHCISFISHVLHVTCVSSSAFNVTTKVLFWCVTVAGAAAAANRRGRGGGHRGRGRFNVRRDGPMKFEKDFDFESANAQFNKDEIDKEFQSKLKLKGSFKSLASLF